MNGSSGPGFVNPHSHTDLYLLAHPQHEPKIRQGVTTEVLGQDGISYAPVSGEGLAHWREYWRAVEGRPDLDWDWRGVGEFRHALTSSQPQRDPPGTLWHGAL